MELQGLVVPDRVGERVTHEEGEREGDLERVGVALPHTLPLGVMDPNLLSVVVMDSVPLRLPPGPAAVADTLGVEDSVEVGHLVTDAPPEELRVMEGEGVVEEEELGVLPPPPPLPPGVPLTLSVVLMDSV